MGKLLSKSRDFIFNAGTVPWTSPLNISGKEGRLVKILPKDFVSLFGGASDIAGDLRKLSFLFAEETKGDKPVISMLRF